MNIFHCRLQYHYILFLIKSNDDNNGDVDDSSSKLYWKAY